VVQPSTGKIHCSYSALC